MKKTPTLTIGISKDIRFHLKTKTVQQRTNISAVLKRYLNDYISGKIKYQLPESKEDIVINAQIMIIIPEETRYEFKEKVAKDRTNIRSVMLYFINHYLQEKDEKQAARDALEQVYKDKQLKLFEG